MQAANIPDLINMTLPDLGRAKMTDLSTKYHDTIAVKRIFNKAKNKGSVQGGHEVLFNIMYDVGGSWRFVGLGFTAQANIKNVLTYGTVPWRHMTWNWSVIDEEILMNSGENQIVDILKGRRIAEMASMIVGLERHLWNAPDADDENGMYTIPYYVVKSNTAATTANNDGFNGTVPTGFTAVAGLDPTTDPGTEGGRYRNYATQYTTVSKSDLIRKMRRGAVYTNFKPIDPSIADYDSGQDREWYTNYAVASVFEELLEAQNENLGKDLASMDGKAMFRGAAINVVQELDRDTTNPVYGLQWGVLGFKRLKNRWMQDIPVKPNPNQPTVSTVHNVSTCNLICTDRRQQMVFATDTTMPAA
jgi:hypothetical protein